MGGGGASTSAPTSARASAPQPVRRGWRSPDRGTRFRRDRLRRVAAAGLAALAVWAGVTAVRPPAPPTSTVVVATAEVGLGAVVSAADLRLAQVPAEMIPHGALTSMDQAVGQRSIGAIRPGEVLTDARVQRFGHRSDPYQGSTAGVIFVPVVDPPVLDALRPGDRVDLLGADGSRVAADVVVTGVVPGPDSPGLFVAVRPAQAAAVARQIHPMASGVSVVILSPAE